MYSPNYKARNSESISLRNQHSVSKDKFLLLSNKSKKLPGYGYLLPRAVLVYQEIPMGSSK